MKASISVKQLNDIVEHENKHWSAIFKYEKEHSGEKLYTSYWWEDYYDHITTYVQKLLKKGASVAEIGAGSGKATLLLGDEYKKQLFDISPPAIDFAKYLAKKLKAKHTTFTIGNGFDTKLKSKTYDFTWNIGVIEHYTRQQAVAFISEMVRITKDGGYVSIAVPNFASFQIWKAKLLNNRIFKFVPGYRLDSENNYKKYDVEQFLLKACKLSDCEIAEYDYFRVGNPLPMGSSKIIIKTIGKITDHVFVRNRFLLIVTIKLKYKA